MYIRAYDFKPPTATDKLSDFTVRSLRGTDRVVTSTASSCLDLVYCARILRPAERIHTFRFSLVSSLSQ